MFMLDGLLEMFDGGRDERGRGNGPAQRGGIRGLLSRIFAVKTATTSARRDSAPAVPARYSTMMTTTDARHDGSAAVRATTRLATGRGATRHQALRPGSVIKISATATSTLVIERNSA